MKNDLTKTAGYKLWHFLKQAADPSNGTVPVSSVQSATAQPLQATPTAQPIMTGAGQAQQPAQSGITANPLPKSKQAGGGTKNMGIKPMIVNPYLARTMG